MRLRTIVLAAVSLAAAGCNGSRPTAAPAGNALANPGTAAANRAADGAPAATAERPADAAASGVPTTDAWREIVIPAGTNLPVVLDTAVSSATSRVEAPVTAHLSRAVTVHGQTVLAEGSRISGVVTEATRSAKVKGRAHVAVRFDTLTPRGDDQRYTIHTTAIGRMAASTRQDDALKIGAPAAGGAIIGALFGGKKGALIGGAAAGGAGTAVVLSTRGKEVSLRKGAALALRLSQPVTVRVKN